LRFQTGRSPYTRAYAVSNGYLTLLSDGERLTGAHALGPEAGEWLQRPPWPSAPASRSRCCATPSSFRAEIYLDALKALHSEIARAQPIAGVAS
jgi:hypothetical protein